MPKTIFCAISDIDSLADQGKKRVHRYRLDMLKPRAPPRIHNNQLHDYLDGTLTIPSAAPGCSTQIWELRGSFASGTTEA